MNKSVPNKMVSKAIKSKSPTPNLIALAKSGPQFLTDILDAKGMGVQEKDALIASWVELGADFLSPITQNRKYWREPVVIYKPNSHESISRSPFNRILNDGLNKSFDVCVGKMNQEQAEGVFSYLLANKEEKALDVMWDKHKQKLRLFDCNIADAFWSEQWTRVLLEKGCSLQKIIDQKTIEEAVLVTSDRGYGYPKDIDEEKMVNIVKNMSYFEDEAGKNLVRTVRGQNQIHQKIQWTEIVSVLVMYSKNEKLLNQVMERNKVDPFEISFSQEKIEKIRLSGLTRIVSFFENNKSRVKIKNVKKHTQSEHFLFKIILESPQKDAVSFIEKSLRWGVSAADWRRQMDLVGKGKKDFPDIRAYFDRQEIEKSVQSISETKPETPKRKM